MRPWRRIQLAVVLIVTVLLSISYIILDTSITSHKVSRIIRQRLKVQRFVVDTGHTKKKRQRLPNLENIAWPEREFLLFPTGAAGTRQLPLEAQYSRGQMRTQWKLFHTFVDVMEELGFGDRWMLYGGSLLGSFRHHDIIPWDDDIDVLVDIEVRPALWDKMRTLLPHYTIQNCGPRDKMWAELIMPNNTLLDVEGSRKLNTYGWAWPMLDINYYISNATHIRDHATLSVQKNNSTKADIFTLLLSSHYKTWFPGPKYVYAKSNIFPLVFRPFYKTWVPAPRNTFVFTVQTYPGSTNCSSLTWSHPYEHAIKSRTVSCGNLSERYAFVERSPLFSPVQEHDNSPEELDWVRERLVRGGKVIHEINLVATRGEAYVDTYELRAKSKL